MQLAERFGIHRTTPWLWAKDAANSFPSPVKLSARCTRWKLSDIEAWETAQAELSA
ncbi:helix-turn-helix transcriptional regulator [Aliiroseovarius sp. KMU-71]|uniref:helix-turn-helix transcriptional regulator n=1 Tax=Aliiroseovarius sp. KMU-71 TaxID=3453123 RepID=UPI003F46D3E2